MIMTQEQIIARLEEEIENIEGIKHLCNQRLDDAIARVKRLRFELKFGEESP